LYTELTRCCGSFAGSFENREKNVKFYFWNIHQRGATGKWAWLYTLSHATRFYFVL